MTTDPNVTAALLQAATASHSAAVQRHTEAANRAGRARMAHDAAVAQRDALLARASAGADIVEADLARADAAAKSAQDTRDLHRALADGALRSAQEHEIALLRTVVSDHGARVAAAHRAQAEAAQAVDEAIAAARAELATYLAAGDVLRTLADEHKHHAMHVLPLALTTNLVLAALHPSQHPKMAPIQMGRPDLSIAILRDAAIGPAPGERAQVVHSLAQQFASIAPVAVTPTPKAA